MGDTATETPDDGNPDAEEPEHIDGDDQGEQDASLGQTPAEAAAADGSYEVAKKLDKENERHLKAVSKILDTDMEPFVCGKCDGFGFVQGVQTVLDEFKWDETTEECPYCDGLGQLRVHTQNPAHALRPCITCAGQGFQVKSAQPPNVTAFPVQTPSPTPAANIPAMGTMYPDGTFVPFGASGVNTPAG